MQPQRSNPRRSTLSFLLDGHEDAVLVRQVLGVNDQLAANRVLNGLHDLRELSISREDGRANAVAVVHHEALELDEFFSGNVQRTGVEGCDDRIPLRNQFGINELIGDERNFAQAKRQVVEEIQLAEDGGQIGIKSPVPYVLVQVVAIDGILGAGGQSQRPGGSRSFVHQRPIGADLVAALLIEAREARGVLAVEVIALAQLGELLAQYNVLHIPTAGDALGELRHAAEVRPGRDENFIRAVEYERRVDGEHARNTVNGRSAKAGESSVSLRACRSYLVAGEQRSLEMLNGRSHKARRRSGNYEHKNSQHCKNQSLFQFPSSLDNVKYAFRSAVNRWFDRFKSLTASTTPGDCFPGIGEQRASCYAISCFSPGRGNSRQIYHYTSFEPPPSNAQHKPQSAYCE